MKQAILCSLLVVWMPTAYSEVVKVCYDQWPPMTIYPTQNEPRRGVVIDMFTDIYAKEGYTLEFFEVPYGRGMKMVAQGSCDVLPEKEYSPEGESGFVYAESATFAYPTAFIVRTEDAWQYGGVATMHGKRVATGPGWDYSSMSAEYQQYLDDPANAGQVEIVSGEDDVVGRIFHMIAENRLDIYADNRFVLHYVLHNTGLESKLKIIEPGLEKPLVEKPIFSEKIPADRRNRLMTTWEQGRTSMTKVEIMKYLTEYGIDWDMEH